MVRSIFDGEHEESKIGICLENSLKNGSYRTYKNDPQKEQIIREFNKFLRDQKKIVLDCDKLFLDNIYKTYTYKLYFGELFRNPKKFVLYKQGRGWTTEFNTLDTWQVVYRKSFNTYFTSLFTDIEKAKCSFCDNNQVYYICGNCSAFLCRDCFDERINYYFRYNNIFRCRRCREINIIS